ncbi:unnamed protein product [Euphydryas editha]|uniref:THAP-type domain-containing protein n=1 Tax=Euphydryas editha TaxID=104508 RepID=A0AAU9TMP9_EUPED|nr:unnamed protein product [Euphydryas editha]
MPGCVLRYCKNNSGNTSKCKGITFHREDTWLPSNHSSICSLHFREEDKYTTKTGRRFLKKSAVPCVDPRACQNSTGPVETISEPVSESESIFDTLRKIVLKRKIRKMAIAKKNNS